MGDKKDGADGPGVEVVVQNEKIGSSVFENSALHFGVRGISYSASKWLRLAFQLERRFAGGAEVVHSDGVARRDVEPWRFASGTEEVCGAPGFGADTGTLRSTFVTIKASSWKLKIHAGIRSRLAGVRKYPRLPDELTLLRRPATTTAKCDHRQ